MSKIFLLHPKFSSTVNLVDLKSFETSWCMIKLFRGGRGGGWGGGSSERCLKWGGGVGVVKGSFQKHLKTGGE